MKNLIIDVYSNEKLSVIFHVYSNEVHKNISVKIDKIEIFDDEYVNVYHNSEIALYDCVEFENAISELCQFEVKFTEKMAQSANFSRLEAV